MCYPNRSNNNYFIKHDLKEKKSSAKLFRREYLFFELITCIININSDIKIVSRMYCNLIIYFNGARFIE